MKKLTFVFCILLLVLSGTPAIAAVTLPWSTTYNCSDWTQGQTLSCDGLGTYGNWTTANGSQEQITSAANNPNGGGGKGQRQWNGDGTNNNSGGLKIEFTSSQSQLWVRWYMRYQQGFKWSVLNYDKILYFNPNEPHAVVPEWYGSDYVNVWTYSGQNHTGSGGWTTTMGGSSSDGQWHEYEVHLKMDTNGSNGIAEMWIDGTKRVSYTNVNFGTQAGWTYFLIGSNQAQVSNGSDMAVDFDDIAVNATGYIGPLSTVTDTLAPAAPPISSVTSP